MSRRTTKALPAPKTTEEIYEAAADVLHGPKGTEMHDDPAPEPEAEKVPAEQSLLVPTSLLLAAEMVSSTEETTRAYLCGVHITAKDGRGRLVGTDGHRMFIASFELGDEVPAWLTDGGLTLSNEGLKQRLNMIGKSFGQVRVTWIKDTPKAKLSDVSGDIEFRQAARPLPFPEYERVIPAAAFSNLEEGTGEAHRGPEWEPVGINSRYLKHIGDLAKILDNGLDKSARSPAGMVVRAFSATPGQPMVFDFSNVPGAILVLMPVQMTGAIASETAALLEGPVKLTIAALRAHATRNRAWAADAKQEFDKKKFTTAAEGFDKRVAAILEKIPGFAALAAPEPAPEPVVEPQPEPVVEAAPEPEPEVVPEPVVEPVSEIVADLTVEPDDEQAEQPVEIPEPAVIKAKRKSTRIAAGRPRRSA